MSSIKSQSKVSASVGCVRPDPKAEWERTMRAHDETVGHGPAVIRPEPSWLSKNGPILKQWSQQATSGRELGNKIEAGVGVLASAVVGTFVEPGLGTVLAGWVGYIVARADYHADVKASKQVSGAEANTLITQLKLQASHGKDSKNWSALSDNWRQATATALFSMLKAAKVETEQASTPIELTPEARTVFANELQNLVKGTPLERSFSLK